MCRWIQSSKLGTLLLAMRDKEDRVRFSGYDVASFRIFTFCLAAALSGIGGAMFTLQVGFMSPSFVGIVPSIEMVIFAAVGGRHSLVGAVTGTEVPDGPLTSRLQHLKEGDEVLISRKATGTLVIDNLEDGRNLYLIGTGTGLAQFLSVIKDPETYERFEKVVLLHGCRRVKELAYGEMITEKLPNDELIGELVRNQLIYYPTVTRDPFRNRGRITDLMASGKLFSDINLASLDAAHDRVMICGSPALLSDTHELLTRRGFVEGNHGEPGQFVVEKAFAER